MTRARSELRESNPRLRFVGPRPSHWTKLGYRQWVLTPPNRAYETQLRAGAAGVAPTRGVEPLEPAFVAPVPNSVGGGMGALGEPRTRILRLRRTALIQVSGEHVRPEAFEPSSTPLEVRLPANRRER